MRKSQVKSFACMQAHIYIEVNFRVLAGFISHLSKNRSQKQGDEHFMINFKILLYRKKYSTQNRRIHLSL